MQVIQKASLKLLAFGALALAAVPVLAAGSDIQLYNTGVGSDGQALTDGATGLTGDQHYTLVSTPAGASSDLRVRTSAGGYPVNADAKYLPDSSTSAWIGPANDPSLSGPFGDYDYRTTFTLPSGNYVISGLWATDNAGLDILINHQSTGNFVAYGDDANGYSFQKYTPFTIRSGFVTGLNTLDFIVHNNSGPTALRVDSITATAAAVPEFSSFSSFGLLGLGLAGLMLKSRKRSKASA